ncbi:MAG TPA: ABC transporter permease [Acidimicrobiales bacterium]|nr:ABC transporter permease [Acidimicrobiales bacterium]
MIRAIGILDLRRLAAVRLRTVIAVVAVAAGSSLALSVVVVSSSVTSSLTSFGQKLAGVAPLRVVGADTSGGLEQKVLSEVSGTPGVAVAVPVVQVATVVRSNDGKDVRVVALGLDCRAGAVVGQAACSSRTAASETSGPPLVSAALAKTLGPSSWVESATGTVPLAHRQVAPALDHFNGGAVVVFALAEAQALFDRAGRLDAIYVLPARSVSVTKLEARLRRSVGSWNGVLAATDPPPQLSVALDAITPLLILLAVLASGIAAVLVYNVVDLSLEQRRREHAIAAAVGAPPTVIVAGPLIEAGLLGAVGGVLGAAAGGLLAAPTVHSMSSYSTQLLGVTISVHTSPITYLIGLLLGTGIALVAAIRPVRRASRLDVAAELSGRDRRVEQRRALSPARGLALVVVAVLGLVGSWAAQRHGALESWQPGAATIAFLACVFATVLAIAFWAPAAIRILLERRRWKGVGGLAVANLVREPGRTGVVAVAIASSVGVALMTASFNSSVHSAIAQSLARSPQRDSVLVTTAAGYNGFNVDGRVPAASAQAVRRLPGVQKVDELRAVLAGHEGGQLVAVETADDLSGGPTLDVGKADESDYERGEVMVGPALARRLHLSGGSRFALDTPSGNVSVVVEGVWDNGDVTGENVTMTPAMLDRIYGSQLPSAIWLVPARGVAPSQLVSRAASAHLAPDLKFLTPQQFLADNSSSVSAQLAPFWALQRALLLVSFVSVLSTLLLAGLQRRRELGLLAAVGLTPRGLFYMVVVESLVVGAVAAVFGMAMGAFDMASLIQVVPLLVGYHDPYEFDAASLIVYVPLAIAVALVASLWPGWRTSRLRVVEALQYE